MPHGCSELSDAFLGVPGHVFNGGACYIVTLFEPTWDASRLLGAFNSFALELALV